MLNNLPAGHSGGDAKPRAAFTLIELMVVIVIIAIIAAIALPNYVKLKNKAKEAEVKANVHNIQLALERFAVDSNGNYPAYLIGGDNSSLVIPDQIDNTQLPIAVESPVEMASDPMLRDGYVDSYPANPFISNGKSIYQFQKQVGDPMRNALTQSNLLGTRFGPHGNVMGNTLCDPRYVNWTPAHKKTEVSEIFHTWANVQYEFYDIWDGNRSAPFIAGSFFYKSMGELIGTSDPDQRRDIVDLDGKQAILPHNNRDDATYPLSRSMYMLGAWGSNVTKGLDTLGEEPMVMFKWKAPPKRQAANPYVFFFDPAVGNYGMPPVGKNENKIELLAIPPWTRGVNRGHVGPLWGSPYGVSATGFDQLSTGNGNGVRDALVIVLMSGVNDGEGKVQ